MEWVLPRFSLTSLLFYCCLKKNICFSFSSSRLNLECRNLSHFPVYLCYSVLFLQFFVFKSLFLFLSSIFASIKKKYVFSGRPRPNVTWYLDNTVIDESFENRPDGITVNHLSYPNIGRQHVNARFVCMASNTNLMPPNNKVVILDVNCKCR